MRSSAEADLLALLRRLAGFLMVVMGARGYSSNAVLSVDAHAVQSNEGFTHL